MRIENMAFKIGFDLPYLNRYEIFISLRNQIRVREPVLPLVVPLVLRYRPFLDF